MAPAANVAKRPGVSALRSATEDGRQPSAAFLIAPWDKSGFFPPVGFSVKKTPEFREFSRRSVFLFAAPVI
jgi:hypothetical protein